MIMKGATSFLRGIGFKNIRPAYFSWFFNFIFSIFVYWGFYKVFDLAAGNSVLAARGGDEIGLITFLSDISRQSPGQLSLVFSIGLVAAFCYFCLSSFLAGGIYGTLVENEGTSFTNLFAMSIENFFDMVKMFFINLLHVVLVLILPVVLLGIFMANDSFTGSETALKVFYYSWIPLVVMLLVIAGFIYDFSRIFKIKEAKSAVSAFKTGFKFVFSNKCNLLVIFLMYVLALVILYLCNILFVELTDSFLYPTLLFVAIQAFVWVRYYLKIVVIRAEVNLLGTETPA